MTIERTAPRARTANPGDKNRGPVRVIIHNQDGPCGAEDVFVSVNGKAWLIKREHEVDLPPEVLEVLENAEQAVYERDPDGAQREKRMKRFAYSILGPVARNAAQNPGEAVSA